MTPANKAYKAYKNQPCAIIGIEGEGVGGGLLGFNKTVAFTTKV